MFEAEIETEFNFIDGKHSMLKFNAQKSGKRPRRLGRITRPWPAALHITLSVKAVKKLTEQVPTTSSQMQKHSAKPTLRPWVDIIDDIVQKDANLPKRVRTSATQIFQKLREEHGYNGCYNVVQEYVRRARNPLLPDSRSLRRSQRKKKEIQVAGLASKIERISFEARASDKQASAPTIQPVLGRVHAIS